VTRPATLMLESEPDNMSALISTLGRVALTRRAFPGGKMKPNKGDPLIPQSEVPAAGPALLFDAEGDIAQALIESLLDEAHALALEIPSMVFVAEGRPSCTLVFTEPAPMPLVRAMIKRLGSGMLSPVRIEHLKLRPLLRINADGFSLFVRPVAVEVEA
jgi:hypothetical protein